MGKYRIYVSNGFNLDGSRRRFTKTVETDLKGRDLEKFLTLAKYDFEDEIENKDPKFLELSKGSFENYSNWWLNYRKVSDVTKATYETFLDTWILPIIKNKVLESITTGDLVYGTLKVPHKSLNIN